MKSFFRVVKLLLLLFFFSPSLFAQSSSDTLYMMSGAKYPVKIHKKDFLKLYYSTDVGYSSISLSKVDGYYWKDEITVKTPLPLNFMKRVTYTGVLEFSEVTPSVAYESAKAWASQLFQEFSFVQKKEDGPSKKMMLKGKTKPLQYNTFLLGFDFTLTLEETKTGVRYTFNEIGYLGKYAFSPVEELVLDHMLKDTDGNVIEHHAAYKVGVLTVFPALERSLRQYVMKRHSL